MHGVDSDDAVGQPELADQAVDSRDLIGLVVDLDMAEWAYNDGQRDRAIACLQRAVVGVALQPGRLDPAVALARLLEEAGEAESAIAQLDRAPTRRAVLCDQLTP